jgi:ketosteroid isomerase-like protein
MAAKLRRERMMADADTAELNRLAFRYAAAVDACDETAFRSVFTRDAVLHVYHPGESEPFSVKRGHQQLGEVQEAMRHNYLATAHQMTNHLVDVDGDLAAGTVLCTARHLLPGAAEALNIVIRYEDRYERHDGAWLIADRAIRFLWSERTTICASGL